MSRLNNKVALITGSVHSIGKSIAELFLEQGARVIISSKNSHDEGKKWAESVGENMQYYPLDISLEADWQAVTQFIKQKYGKLDILVNNAAIEHPPGKPQDQDPEHCSLSDWKMVHEVNVDGVFLGCKYAISLMKANQNCSIINIGSRSSLVGIPSSAAYSSSKAAVKNFTKTVAIYCAQKGYSIRCNVVHPAAILTKLWDKELGVDENREKRVAYFSKNIPLQRMGVPMDIAYAVLYLASDESQFVTGTELVVDGGIMAGSSASAQETLIEINDG